MAASVLKTPGTLIEMTTDIRTILDFVLAERLRDIGERRGVGTSGSRQEQRERVVRSLGGEVRELLPLLLRAELVEFLATRDLGGRFELVNRASRWDMELLITMLVADDPQATDEQPLGGECPIRFERTTSPASEKVFRSRVKRQRDLIYYVKNGDVWAAPSRHGGSKRVPQRVHQAGVAMDQAYLYYVDADGDIARKRRGPEPAGVNPPADRAARPVRVFISYARADRRFQQELYAAWAGHEKLRKISVSYDDRIDVGMVWEPALMEMVEHAEIAVFLLSNDFMVSTFCNDEEWPRIEARHQRGECEIAPVLIRQCHFSMSPLGRHQLIRPNNQAVDQQNHDDAWFAVVAQLNGVIERARAKRR